MNIRIVRNIAVRVFAELGLDIPFFGVSTYGTRGNQYYLIFIGAPYLTIEPYPNTEVEVAMEIRSKLLSACYLKYQRPDWRSEPAIGNFGRYPDQYAHYTAFLHVPPVDSSQAAVRAALAAKATIENTKT